MSKITFSLTFEDANGSQRSESEIIDVTYPTDVAGEQRLCFGMFSELKAQVAPQPVPKHNETAARWLNFPENPTKLDSYFDVRNSQSIWLELSNLVRRAENDLVCASAFKALEPVDEPPFEDDAALNNLYYLHDRKMSLLNSAVYDMIKIQDLVNRLLHESLGGDLVDTSQAGWEKYELRRKNVKTGLQRKLGEGSISHKDFDAIARALSIPSNAPDIARTYRDRLTHHVRPSVDYHYFFSALESRVGEEFIDSRGQIAKRFSIRTHVPAEYNFGDLREACSAYLDSVVQMLDQLSELDILHR